MNLISTELVNLTPHAVTFVDGEGATLLVVEPSGVCARLNTETVQVGVVNGIPVTSTRYGEIEGLPDPKEGTAYIVSSLVAQQCHDRDDVFIPNESVRDDKGRIVGCKSLGRI